MGEGRNGTSHLSYRSDIDGLRALAVLLVLADHFRTHFSGGYVGVDVFFVISGYLISAAILKEMANGTFSIASFYERRIRRIFPALIVMLLGSSVLAYHFLFPTELADYAKSLLAAMFSVSNFWFWHQAGYFDAPSAFKPLLHTWSLGVEEQFYIFFPIFLVLLRRFFPNRLRPAIFGFAAISFALAVLFVKRDASAAFFFSPLRAWELLLGTIVSQRYLPAIRGPVARNLAALSGLLLIVIPALRYTSDTPFPGIAALPPCLGAALIIAAGETGSSLVGRLLSLRPVVFVGLISYSLYLWHWPVLVFQHIGNLVLPLPEYDRRLKLALFLISILLGFLSWLFVETPFRKGRLRPARSSLFLISGIGTACVSAFAIVILVQHGLPRRFPPDALQAAQYLAYDRREAFREGSCFLGSSDSFSSFQSSPCLAEDSSRKNVLILGDSQAAQLWFGLNSQFPAINFLQATAFACPLYVAPPADARPACTRLAAYLHQDFLLRNRVDLVILGGRWTANDIPYLTVQLAWMRQHNIPVLLVGPMLEYDEPFPRVLAAALRAHAPGQVAAHMTAGPRALDTEMEVRARDLWHVPYISYYTTLCTPGCASYGAPGVPLLFDEHHLTAAGSVLFATRLRDRYGAAAILPD